MKSVGESILLIQKGEQLIASKDITKLTLGDVVIPVPPELDILVLYFCQEKKK